MNDLYQNKGEEVQTSFSFSSDVLAKALQRIYSQKMDVEGEIEPNLFHEICRILDDAAADGVAQSEVKQVDDFLQQLQTNNEVFAAFKVHRMQRDMVRLLFDSNGTLKPFEKWVQEVTPIASHQVRHWLQTEYDTAVLRAHQAADWQQFLRERDVLPNLKWMPSTSLHPGADHRPFWNTIRPIDDPFWSKHRPGDRWNCKCDLTATDEEPTQLPDDDNNSKAQPGLATLDDLFHQVRVEAAFFYLLGLMSCCIFLYLFFTFTAYYYIGYPCLVLYAVWVFRSIKRTSHYKFSCGNCGAKMKSKGTCPHCGAINE